MMQADTHCYACAQRAMDQCENCRQWFCEQHGQGRCDRCRDIPGGYPPRVVYRLAMGALVVSLALAGWHLLAWPEFPAPEARTLSALEAPRRDATEVTPIEPTPAPTSEASATPAPAVSPTPSTQRYVVQGGDNLSGIAVRFGVTVSAIAAANNIEDPTLIRPGQELIIPPRTP